MKKRILAAVGLMLVLSLMGCGTAMAAPADGKAQEDKLITEMVNLYGKKEEKAHKEVQNKLDALCMLNPQRGALWQGLMDYWRMTHENYPLSYDRIPESIPDSKDLCLVVLGYQLNSDGTPDSELLARLKVALENAKTHPHAKILCTGGGTAPRAPAATEADVMARWLIQNGIDEKRILIENKSYSTTENAILCHKLLLEKAPEVRQIVIITSDYHAGWGAALFEAQFRLHQVEEAPMTVVGNAVCKIEDPIHYSFRLQSNGMLEIAGLL